MSVVDGRRLATRPFSSAAPPARPTPTTTARTGNGSTARFMVGRILARPYLLGVHWMMMTWHRMTWQQRESVLKVARMQQYLRPYIPSDLSVCLLRFAVTNQSCISDAGLCSVLPSHSQNVILLCNCNRFKMTDQLRMIRIGVSIWCGSKQENDSAGALAQANMSGGGGGGSGGRRRAARRRTSWRPRHATIAASGSGKAQEEEHEDGDDP